MPAVTGWREELHARFGLDVAPTMGFAGGESLSASFGLDVAPALSLTATRSRSTSAFGIDVAPSLGVVAGSRNPAGFGLDVPPALWMAARERYKAAFGIDVAPQIGAAGEFSYRLTSGFALDVSPELDITGVERYKAAFGLDLAPQLGMTAAEQYISGFSLDVPPAFGMVGREHYKAAFGIDVAPSLSMAGELPGPVIPVTFDAVATGSVTGANANSWSWTHTATAGAYVVVATGAYQGEVPTAATYGGQAMTLIGTSTTSNRGGISFWGLANAPGGAQTVSVTRSSSAQIVMTSVSFLNATSAAMGNAAYFTNVKPSIAQSCTTGQMILQAIGFCYVPPASRPLPAITGGTAAFVALGTQYAGLALSYADAATTFALNYTMTYSGNGAGLILS